MKDLFPGYYRPTEEEFKTLWDTCTFIPDTNVLLNLYRYSPETRETLLSVLESLSQRIWIPYQVAEEYHERRNGVILDRLAICDKVISHLEKALKSIISELGQHHPFIDGKVISDRLTELTDSVIREWEQPRRQYAELVQNDSLGERIASLFTGRVGEPYDEKKLKEVFKAGEDRYAKRIPPGFAEKKEDNDKFGDLVIWMQILEHAKPHQTPIVFITDDSKEDWWLKSHGQVLGPRPELVQEMKDVAGARYYSYSASSFMRHAALHLEQSISDQAVDEVKEVEEQTNREFRVLEPFAGAGLLDAAPRSEAFDQLLTSPPYAPGIDIQESLKAASNIKAIHDALIRINDPLANMKMMTAVNEVMNSHWYNSMQAIANLQKQQYLIPTAELLSNEAKRTTMMAQAALRRAAGELTEPAPYSREIIRKAIANLISPAIDQDTES